MGVPKFYRWISERYPCLSEVVKEYQIPEFDNLYLDMNGIIHVCSHPEDDNPHFRITEEKIFESIFHYIEVLFRMIKPRKVFFMAVDGVAPRAKMNQQRGRRFRSAREAEDLVKKALEKGEVLPTEARFDSNCITPGTEFMDKLQDQLKYFVVKKASTDRLWQGVRVYLSGHETPGEGEHKVMDFIRHEKSRPDFDSNTRHCLYGLDADLMMLGLTSHEPHFSLLREEVRFGKQNQKRSSTVEETTFHLLHLSLMREYIDFEFSSLKDKLSFPYDLERIIDDWVLMGFLVGNDFIPHLPDLHIHHNALPMLWKTYKKVLPTLPGYLNDGGTLNLPNFEAFMRRLSKFDVDNFREKHADLQWFNNRRREKMDDMPDALSSEQAGIPTANEFMSLRDDASGDEDETFQTTLQSDMEAMAQELDFYEDEEREEEEEYEEDDSQFYVEFQKFKAGYYRDKLEYPKVTEAVIHEQCFEYVKAIQWILHYYFNGVQSWSWFYPFHYAPYLSDIRSFSDFKLPYDRSYPFFPFQQLMAVLPSASKNLIPLPLQSLMLDETSPVKDFYPEEFSTDLNGKQQEWEAVVQIPFIDEKRLLSAMKPLEAKMTDEEKARNKHGPHTLFVYSATPQGTYTSTVFPDLYNHHAVITDVPMEEFWLAPRCIKKGLMDGVKQDVYFPGFPTLKHLPHTAKLMKSGVKVFQHASKGENMVLHLENSSDCDHEDMAQQLIGKSVYVAWPHLMEARVNAISDDETRFYGVELHSPKSKSHKMTIQSEDLEPDQAKVWRREVESIRESYMSRKAVDIGQTYLLVYASLLSGRRYICGSQGKVTLDKQYSNTSQPFVLQGTVRDIAVKDPSYREYSTLEDLFSEKSEVFMLGNPHYGAMGEVLSVDSKNDGRVRVDFTIQTEPSLAQVAQHGASLAMQYFPGYSQARRLGITPYVMSRITGSVFINRGSKEKTTHDRHNRVNVGLNLKFNKSGNEVPGYTKKLNDEWLYSNKLQQVLGQYLAEYPQMFEFIARNNDESSYYEANIFKNSEHTLADVAAFLKKLPTASVQPVPFGSNVLDENIVEKIQEEVTKVKEINRKKKKHIKMQVRPHLLFRPLEAQLTLTPDPSTTWELFDRIVNVRDGFSVPLGLRGTLIGVTNAEKEQDVLYDVVFDEEFLGGLTIRCSPNCAYRMPKTAMVNISHGERKTQGKSPVKPTAVVKPQASAWGGPIGTYDFYAENSPGQRGGRHKGGNHGNNDRGYSNKDGNHGNRQQGGHNRQLNFGGAQQDSNRQAEGNRGNRQAEGNRGNRQQTWQQAQQSQQGSQPQNQGGRNMRGQNRGNQGNQRGPHGNQGGGFQDNMTGPDDNQGEFAEMWRQLQTSYAPPPPGTQPPAQLPPGMLPNQPNVPPHAQQPTQAAGANSQPRHGKAGHQDKHKTPQAPAQGQGPSLQDAAIALQVAHIEDNKHAEDRRGQKIDLGQLFNTNVQFEPSKNSKKQKKAPAEPDAFSSQSEFSAIFNALQLGDKPAEVPEPPPATMGVRYLQESTAALCQMLKITPGDGNQGAASNHGNSNQGAASNHGNSNQGGASNHCNSNQGGGPPAYGKQLSVQDLFGDGKDATPQSKGQGQDQPPKDANKPRSAVENLSAWCRSMCLPPPDLSSTRTRDDRHRAVVRLSNGHVFNGSFAKSETQAMESAAGVALLQLTKGQNFPAGGFPPHGPPPGHFGGPPMFPPGGPPFPAGPPFSGGPPPPGPHPQQQGQQGGPPPRLSASPNSAFTPVRQQMGPNAMPNMPGMPPFPAWDGTRPMFPPPPHFGPPPPHHQQRFHQRNQQPRGQAYQGQGHQPRGQGHGIPPGGFQSPPKQQRDRRNQDGRQGQQGGPTTEATTPKKQNPFVPFQVMQKQKTPQKDSRKDDSDGKHDRSSSPEVTQPKPATAATLAATEPSVTTTELSPQPAKTPTKPATGATQKPTPSKDSANRPPARRPKSRIAAKFNAL